ncbi:hypothetical protein Hanom_Chr14g01265181 [Helianthus anomalus]
MMLLTTDAKSTNLVVHVSVIMCFCVFLFVLFDYLLIYSMGKQRISDIYRQLDKSPKDKGTSSQSNSSRYSADTKEGIFVRKAQFEEPLTAKKRRRIIRKSQEKEMIRKLRK